MSDTPKGCVIGFIIAAEQHDMNKAWESLGKDAQTFYNALGEKMRKSGKGALENEINRIKTFRNAQRDYSIRNDKDSPGNVRLITSGGMEFVIEMEDNDGVSRIKDGSSVRSILTVITSEQNKQIPY
jgi:hypothetical protein